jgi:autotransporter strand-loop-strand O-heptosyltransferase
MKKSKIKLLYLTPHLSTGGMPQFVLKRIQELQKYKEQIEIFLVEFSQFSNTYVVQRDKIIDLLGESHFFSLGDTTDTKRKYELIDIIKNNNIDIVHSEEMLEGFESFNKIPLPLLNQLYSNDRTWKMVETCHNVWFNPKTHKKFNPEAYCFVTPYHLKETFLNETPMKFLSLYPIENKVTKILEEYEIYGDFNQVPLIRKIVVREELGLDMFKTHVLNVGLWTSGKNQGEGVEVARELIESNPDIQFHFIGNQAPNFEDYWGPIMKDLPSNVKVWGERNDVEKFMTACDVLMFNSTWECNPLVVRESINYGMKILARDLPQYMGMFDGYITPIEGDVKNISKQLVELIENKDVYKILPDNTFGEDLLNFYNAVTNINITQNKPLTKDYTFVRHYVTQPYFEVQGTTENKLNIKYYNDKNEISYQNELPINSWVKLNKEYFIKWRTTVEENGEVIYDETLDLKDKRVYISFGSKSLGDTMAWIPYCEVFRKKHGCKLIVSTFLNSLFKDQYPDIEFVEPGDLVTNIHAQYRLGWHYTSEGVYDNNKHPFDFKKMPLQKTATDILGLDYKEVRPLLKLPNTPKKKKVGIGFHSTAQAKYWNNPDGWQAVIDHLNNLGYECMVYSKEGDGYMNNYYPEGVTIFKGGNLQEVIDDLSSCEFFIGLGSGLSWLAWACKLPVVLISGFSEKWAETTLDTYRVINESVCHGCFNSDRLDAGDWNWCPQHKNTDRMFECTKEISSDMVIKEINKIINKEVIEEKIDEVSFDWGKKNEWYVDTAIQEIENDKLIQTMDGFDYSTVNNRCLFDDGVIVDVGCLNWDWSNFFLGKKRVVGIDPFEEQIPFTELFKGVISNYNGTTKMKFSNEASTIINQSEGETVQVRTWKHFCNEYNIKKISVLKINIEGSEYDLLDSLTDDDFDNIDQIAVSFHDWMIPEWKSKTERSIKILKSKNYDIQKINDSWGWYLAVKNKSTKEKIIKKESNSDLVTIILSHANTKEKRKILIEHLKTINTKILLSTNYPIDDEIKVLCDYVIYDENNPILLKEDFNKYNVSWHFYRFEEGVEVRESFDYEHGYAVYKLIQNGLTESKKLGFKYSHIINYDYLINKNTLQDHYKLLENYDCIFYTYENKKHREEFYSMGFFTGKIDELIKPFTHYKTKDEYYNYDGYNKTLEIITRDAVKKQNLKVKELFYEDLKETSIVNRVVDDHKKTNKKIMEENEFKKISDYYNCDKTSTHTYHNVYSKIFEGIRNEAFSLLEIGIHEGASLNVWRDYLTNANIYGLDINREFSHDRGYIFKGDQNNLFDLEKITSEIKSCKVIIDDASHNPQHQIKTFNYLFENLLEDGGYYIIEDVETSYWDPLSELYGYEIGYLNVVDYFSKLTHNVNYKYNGFNNTLKIESILFTSNCIVIKKLMK